MIDWLKAIQLKPRSLFGAFVFCALLLFTPAHILAKFGISIQETGWQPVIGLICIGSFVFWIVQLIPHLQQARHNRSYKQSILSKLKSLSDEEWTVLWYCLDQHHQTIRLSAVDKIATSLTSKGILYCPSGTYDITAWPYTIPDFLWNYLVKNKDQIFADIPLTEEDVNSRMRGLHQHIHRHDH